MLVANAACEPQSSVRLSGTSWKRLTLSPCEPSVGRIECDKSRAVPTPRPRPPAKPYYDGLIRRYVCNARSSGRRFCGAVISGFDPERTAVVRRNSRVFPADRWYLVDRGEELTGPR